MSKSAKPPAKDPNHPHHIYLIDGSGYIFRAYFALPPMTRPDGTPVLIDFGLMRAEGSATLHEALNFGGGGGVDGAARNLLRAATASLLNTSHSGVAYPRTTSSVIADTNAALASGDRATMLGLAASIDRDNNLGCPLN